MCGGAGALMWARLVLQLLAVGGRMPTEHGMHKHSADAVAEPDRTLVPRDPRFCLMRWTESKQCWSLSCTVLLQSYNMAVFC